MDIANRMKKIKEIDNNIVIATIVADSDHGPLIAVDACHRGTEIIVSNAIGGTKLGYCIKVNDKDFMTGNVGYKAFAKLKEHFIRDCKRGNVDPNFYNQVLEQAELNLKEAV